MALHQYPLLQINDGIEILALASSVEILQQFLKHWGILPKDAKVDGRFGPFTKAAVERFQSMRPPGSRFAPQGLTVTGIVDQGTWAELLQVPLNEVELLPRPELDAIPAVLGFDIDTLINTAVLPSLKGIARRTVPFILAECTANQVHDKGQVAYILATAEHESHLGNLMTEIGDEDYFRRSYDPPSNVAKQLGNQVKGDGPRYRGRGFVQITGRRNYTDWAKHLNIDLLNQPEMATIPPIAAKILVMGMMQGTFTGAALGEFVQEGHRDFVEARQVVNGHDRATHIAEIAQVYFNSLI
jgi:hypothetical protein